MDYFEWETKIYPKMHAEALAAGRQAKVNDLPRECDLTDPKFIHNGEPLKVFRKIWEQGYDGWTDPAKQPQFQQIEQFIKQLPTRPMTQDDI